MNEVTDRLALPLIAPGQAQKEMTVNEALTLLDAAAQASAMSAGQNTPPAAPEPGQCWIVGAAPTGAWAGRAGYLASWTVTGWRFLAPREGWSVWVEDEGGVARHLNGDWQVVAAVPAIAVPAGGSTIDDEARAAIQAIVAALEHHGLTLSA